MIGIEYCIYLQALIVRGSSVFICNALVTICQFYHGSQLYWYKKQPKIIDMLQTTSLTNSDYTKKQQKQNTICLGHHYAQASTNNVNKHKPSYKQLEVETNRTSFLCGNRNRQNNTGIIKLYTMRIKCTNIKTHSVEHV